MTTLGFRMYLLSQTTLTIIITIIGNIYMAIFSLKRKAPSQRPMRLLLFNISISNILAAFLCMPCHLLKIISSQWSLKLLGNISCLARYGFMFVFAPLSLILLTLLCCFRRDQITKAPFGKENSVNQKNSTRIITLSWVVSVVPNFVFLSAYVWLMVSQSVSPCQPDQEDQKTSLYYLGIAESVKSSIIFGSCVTVIIRAVPKIRQVLRRQAAQLRSSGLQSVDIRKVNASFGFAGAFLLMWVPFGLIALSSSSLPPDLYDDFFNTGYTFASASFAVTPAIYACVDKNFRRYISRSTDGNPSRVSATTAIQLSRKPNNGGPIS